ncbi:MAG TPA: TetR/AcrR family transcriptional regulator [Jatrophihabitantaceae bacterium]|nr:TetR/AcrR family transcriptional regulator [Jatrophihabitantaceae bacterium]
MTSATRTRKPGARDRLIAAAERLFYTEGIRAVGVDRLCAEAEVSKRSLYQHFAGKDEVVTAMLEAKAAEMSNDLIVEGLTPRDRILHVFEQGNHLADAPGSCGCPFVSAATELKDREHPAAQVALVAKRTLTDHFAAALREGGVSDADSLALQLTLIFDGASAYAVIRGGSTPATRAAVETLLAAHGMPARS